MKQQLLENESEIELTQSCPTLGDPMDGSLPGSEVHGIFQARILEWAAIFFSRGSSQPRDQTLVRGTSHVASLEFPPETGLTLRCARKAGNPFQTKQGNRLSCRDQEGRRGSDEVVPGPSVFPSREPSVSGNFCGRIKGVKYRFALQDGTWDFPGDTGNFGVPLE